MRKVSLSRYFTGNSGTFGTFVADGKHIYASGELPWKNNVPNKSCVTAAKILFTWQKSAKRGFCYQEYDDPETAEREDAIGRDLIQIHSANFMGDQALGLKCELEGCIALGEIVGTLDGQIALIGSRKAMADFEAFMNKEPFELNITWVKGVGPS